MDIIEAELFSLLIVVAILFDRGRIPLSQQRHSWFGFTGVLAIYLMFLVSGGFAHASSESMIRQPDVLIRFMSTFHSIAYIVFILIWMALFQRNLLSSSFAKRLFTVQAIPLGVFSLLSIVSDIFGSLGMSSSIFLPGSLWRVLFMNGLAVTYCVSALVVIGVKWPDLDRQYRMTYIINPSLLIISIILFQISREHIIFTVSSSVLLLASHLLSQHQRWELDALTGLPNQSGYLRHMETILRKREPVTLVVIDMENFRFINQHYGQNAGDYVLKQFSTFINNLDPQITTFRIGGNRFALSMRLIDHNKLVRMVNDMNRRIEEGWVFDSVHVSFHVNIGVLELPTHAASISEVLDTVDFLLNELNSLRRQTVLIYNKKLVRIRQRRLDVLTVLRRALVDPDKVKVHLQPIYAASNRRIVAAEALMRIEDESFGLLMPGEFIPLAESSGLISSLTEIILRKVCEFIVANEAMFTHVKHISVNISADDFSSSDLPYKLLQIIKETKVDPSRLCFEMTESVMMSSYESVRAMWMDFARLGVKFALDDFGTGYANLESLVNIPFDIIKIDRSVVSNRSNNYQLVNLIVVVLEKLGKEIVAEGVETESQLEFIQAAGVDYIQGYYFSKPITVGQFLDMIRYDNAR
ncbi:putative bifunctional diguanylate cyclase/phosphodiesterase [Pleomorphochaeta sp. DL1XJH-081]|uniref:putative bifunctional diguanylate cyclase/phosphodiesterase n=1 Tax=Pleomorphochaeta sp. DL1XJH-081 TaxID=3409690 RepID=UPI003BB5FD1E